MGLHSGESLCQREGGDEDTCVERGIASVADFEVKYELPGIRKDGSQSDRFAYSDESWCLSVTAEERACDGDNIPRMNSCATGNLLKSGRCLSFLVRNMFHVLRCVLRSFLT